MKRKQTTKPPEEKPKTVDVAPEDIGLRFELLLGLLREKAPKIHLEIGTEAVVPIIAMLWQGMRTPNLDPRSYAVRACKVFIAMIEATLMPYSPEVVQLLRMMNDPRYDVVIKKPETPENPEKKEGKPDESERG